MNEQKKIREQRYINEDQLIALIKGEENALEAIEKVFWEEQDKKKQEDKRSQYHEPKVGTISVTRNAIDRIKGGTLKRNEAGQLFHVPEQYLTDPINAPQSEETGLFFLAKVAPAFLPVFEAALRYLQHAGLGGDRNTGKGHFELSWDNYTALPQISQPNAMTNLSLYAAVENEVEQFEKGNLFKYKLENRQGRLGFINNPAFLKKPLMMFAEGAVFPYLSQASYGMLVDVTTKQQEKALNHKLWHNGYSFMVNMRVKEPKSTDQN
jgi:CRISPR type III-A-associated RAMP protein Csm4